MRCIVTAGPTFEPLDAVRRITNFSTGRLGSELADYLAARGHEVTLLIGEQATFRIETKTLPILTFGTTASLRERLDLLAGSSVDAVFHAAAVSDFSFGKVWKRSSHGELVEVKTGKFTTREGSLLAELVPTSKLIQELREWFPKAFLVGWKYEVDGDRSAVLCTAQRQISECRTNACVLNGAAYGVGFGLVTADGECLHSLDRQQLFKVLEEHLVAFRPA